MDFLFVYTYIFIYVHLFFIYMYLSIYLFVFSRGNTMSVQVVLNRLPHAAHTTIPWITFCNMFMRFTQSKKFNVFISNVFYMVAYNWNT